VLISDFWPTVKSGEMIDFNLGICMKRASIVGRAYDEVIHK